MEFSPNERPVSTTSKIVFPFYINRKGLSYKFDISFYKSYFTNNRLSEEALNTFFGELYMTVNHFGSLKLWEGSTEKLMFRYVLGIFIIVGSILTDHDRDDLFDTIFVWFCCCCGLLILVNSLVFLLVVIRQKAKAEQKLFIKLQKIIEKNNQDLQPLGLSWRLANQDFSWIGLELNSKLIEDDSFSEKAVLFFEFDSSECKYFLCDSKHMHKSYNSELTDNRLSKHELDSFLSSLTSIAQKHSFGSATKMLLFVGVCLALEFIVFVSLRKESYGRILFVLMIVSLYVAKFFFRKAANKEYDLTKSIKDEISELLNQKKQHFSSHGLRWHLVGEDFTYIDLWLDYKFVDSSNLNSSFNAENQTETTVETASEIQINMDPEQMLLAESI